MSIKKIKEYLQSPNGYTLTLIAIWSVLIVNLIFGF